MAARAEGASPDKKTDESADCLRRKIILTAAYGLLEEEGLEGLTIRAMLKRTGLARRAFYERFEGKDDLVLAVFEETLQQAADFFAEEVKTQPDAVSQLRLVILGLVHGSQPQESGIGGRVATGGGSGVLSEGGARKDDGGGESGGEKTAGHAIHEV